MDACKPRHSSISYWTECSAMMRDEQTHVCTMTHRHVCCSFHVIRFGYMNQPEGWYRIPTYHIYFQYTEHYNQVKSILGTRYIYPLSRILPLLEKLGKILPNMRVRMYPTNCWVNNTLGLIYPALGKTKIPNYYPMAFCPIWNLPKLG